MRVSRLRVGVAVLVGVLLVPSVAYAADVFADVDDGAFYAAPVKWAFENEITFGRSDTSFAPDDGVTRGEAVTFLKRYNDNVIEPALSALEATITEGGTASVDNTAQIDANTATGAANTDAIVALQAQVAPLVNSVAAFAGGSSLVALATSDQVFQSVTIMPPADGIVIVNSSAYLDAITGASAGCSITTGTSFDFSFTQAAQATGTDDFAVLAGTRGFDVQGGILLTVNLVCFRASGSEGSLADAALTAIFAPT